MYWIKWDCGTEAGKHESFLNLGKQVLTLKPYLFIYLCGE